MKAQTRCKDWIVNNRMIGMVVALCFFFSPSLALSESATERLASFFENDSTIFAEFHQVVLDEGLNVIDESTGLMWLARPDKFRWEYKSPYEQTIVSDGVKVWSYDIELEQVTIQNSSDVIGDTPAVILAGKGEIEKNYNVVDLGVQGNLSWVVLEPKITENAQFEVMRLAFGANTLEVVEMVGLLGDTTRIEFFEIIRNSEFSDETFQFESPEGVDIIQEG